MPTPPSRARQIDEGIKTTPKYFEMQTEQSVACAKAKPAKKSVESSVQLVPIKNETLFFFHVELEFPILLK